MIPLRDSNPTHKLPVITMVLIGINVLVWLLELYMESQNQLNEFISQWAVIPVQLLNRPLGELTTVFSSMFLHGSWSHLLGNMLYLWIFGDNIEDRMGPVRFVVFYLIAGIIAALLQVFLNPDSRIPLVGASGAIAGVMGGYLLLYPRAQVVTLIGYYRANVPAIIVLGAWFGLQLISGVGDLNSIETANGGGVAFWAHVGGFIAGMVMVKPFLIGRPQPTTRRPPSNRYS
jgi:membrane associated rhomboid family serine protease